MKCWLLSIALLMVGVVASDATRKTAEEIEAYLASLMPSL